MSTETTRRGFMGIAAGVAGFSAAGMRPAAGAAPADLKLGVATYSLRYFQRPLAIKMIKEMQISNVSIKEFHLPYRSNADEIAAARKDFSSADLTITSGGVIYLFQNDETDMRRYFEYAKAAGMPMIICGPTHDNIKLLEKLVKEYNIKAAIHNHGPEDKHFPTPQSALDVVKGLDPRLGVCIDIGHSTRAGVDVVKAVAEAGPRLLDFHVKDLKSPTDKTSQCDVGEGVLPIVAVFQQLKKMNYQGVVHLEYEINVDAPLTGMLKSFSYMRGVIAGLRG